MEGCCPRRLSLSWGQNVLALTLVLRSDLGLRLGLCDFNYIRKSWQWLSVLFVASVYFSKQPMGCDAQLAGRHIVRGNVRSIVCRNILGNFQENVQWNIRTPMQDYRSLRAAVTSCASSTMVNTHTHTCTQTQLLTSYTISSASWAKTSLIRLDLSCSPISNFTLILFFTVRLHVLQRTVLRRHFCLSNNNKKKKNL